MPTGVYERPIRFCSIEECGKRSQARGYCNSHYYNWRKYGDPEHSDRQRSSVLTCGLEACQDKHHSKGYCYRHYHIYRSSGQEIDPGGRVEVDLDPEFIVCTKCQKAQPLSEYRYRERFDTAFYEKTCKTCQLAKQEEWFAANPDRRRTYNREGKVRRTYGEPGLAILERIDAGEGCEVCGQRTKKMAIDHCHRTNVVRGLLCGNCNTALGLLGEDEDRILALVRYMLRHHSSSEQSEIRITPGIPSDT